MAYQTYHTKAIVLDSKDLDEASKQLVLLTRDQGLVRVRAQGLRRLRSKMRYSLQLLSLVRLGLVRGKFGWRVVDCELIETESGLLRDDAFRVFVGRMTVVYTRALEEGSYPLVYDDTVDAMQLAREGVPVADIERVLLYRVLYRLGYVRPDTESYVLAERLDRQIVERSRDDRERLARAVAGGLKETQL